MKKSERLTEENSATVRKMKLELERKEQNRKRLKTVITIVLFPAIFGTGFALGNFTNSTNVDSHKEEKVTVEKVQYSVSGKSAEEDKKDAVNALKEILISAHKSKENKGLEERLKEIDNDNYNDVDSKVIHAFYWADGLDKREDVRKNAIQGLVTIGYLVDNKGLKFEPQTKDINSVVYLDQKTGRAYIPASVFLGPSNGASIEMIYNDETKEWKIDPYSFVETLRLSAKLQEQMTNQQ